MPSLILEHHRRGGGGGGGARLLDELLVAQHQRTRAGVRLAQLCPQAGDFPPGGLQLAARARRHCRRRCCGGLARSRTRPAPADCLQHR